jgi:hypothetical protein
MEAATIRLNKYLPIAIVYFFFNSLFLPHGLLYTAILTPLFLLWLYRFPLFNYVWLYFVATAPFVVIHLWNGVKISSYFASYTILFTVYVFCLVFYQFLKECKSLGNIYKNISLINFVLVGFALIALFIPWLRDILWSYSLMTSFADPIYRLKLFTYEASYYSLLLLPITLFYYLKLILQKYPDKWLTFFIVTIPLLLSLSFGVILGLIISLFLIFCSDIRLFTYSEKFPRYFITAICLVVIGLMIIWKLNPDNILFVRIANIIEGHDTSFRGRTFDSLYLGWQLAAQKSLLFGAGPGQIKEIGLELFTNFYNWGGFTTANIAIPNSIGDTMATFGLLGVLIKLSLVVYFFFRTDVHTNFYRLGLFLFIVIYQFTGSFISNITEYAIWLLAFHKGLFPEFDKRNIFLKSNLAYKL